MSGPRVFDGQKWSPVSEGSSSGTPVQPVLDGDGKIFVSIVSYRDGERCGETLRSLFENAEHPDNIVVGLSEQNAPEDKFCLEQYCSFFGSKTIKRQNIREGVVKIVANDSARESCPHYNQVRLVAFHHIQAKGPTYARSLVRKILGNEEFCMQVDAHTDFARGWDELALSEWKKTENEFGILSNVPADKSEKESYPEGAEKFTEVPRQCIVRFLDNGFPDYTKPADGKVAGLDTPLLGHGWSAAFSFAKCHLEESAPYDNFSLYAMPIEQFSRFARFWTRGYDVYTPTRNIVFHDYGIQANGHGENEWFKRQRDRFRQTSIVRVKTILQLPGGEIDANDQANLGIYGLGKRRTLEQLSDFAGLDLTVRKGNMGPSLICSGHEWVPYDTSMSPIENLFTNPDNLDPQPEYPLRTNLLYYQQVSQSQPLFEIESDSHAAGGSSERKLPVSELLHGPDGFDAASNIPSIGSLAVFWVFGLIVWCIIFMPIGSQNARGLTRKKSDNLYKDV